MQYKKGDKIRMTGYVRSAAHSSRTDRKNLKKKWFTDREVLTIAYMDGGDAFVACRIRTGYCRIDKDEFILYRKPTLIIKMEP